MALSLRSMGRQMNKNTEPIADQRSAAFMEEFNKSPYRPNTLLFFHHADDLKRSSGIVNRNEAFLVERLPGLYVMLSSSIPNSHVAAKKGPVAPLKSVPSGKHMLIPKTQFENVQKSVARPTAVPERSQRRTNNAISDQLDQIAVVPSKIVAKRPGRPGAVPMAVVPKATRHPFFDDTTTARPTTTSTTTTTPMTTMTETPSVMPATLAPFPAMMIGFQQQRIALAREKLQKYPQASSPSSTSRKNQHMDF